MESERSLLGLGDNSLSPIVVLIGEGSLLAACAEVLLEARATIAAIATDDRRLLSWSRERGIPTLEDWSSPEGFP